MKILSPEKLLKALDFAWEQREKEIDQKTYALWQIRDKVKKLRDCFDESSEEHGEAEEVMSWLTCIMDDVREEKYRATPANSLSQILLYHLKLDAMSQVRAEKENNPNLEHETWISSDFGEHCFFFSENYKDGHKGICGGLIYHGFPDEGYMENGSVMLDPSYGWSQHT